MKISAVLFTAAAAFSAAYADDTPATVSPGDADGSSSTTSSTPTTTTKAPTSTTSTSTGSSTTSSSSSPLDGLTQKAYGSEYHMPYVRVVHARVQSDKPELIEGRFVSKYGNGDLKKGYQSAMDTVNTASVEGALMYVQAEGINQNSRSSENRCKRKNDMNYIVLYEILIAQTNETIAQYDSSWNVPEYGPMIPMDNGRCTPLTGETFPPECLMFNGVDGNPNVGPFVGAGLKNDDVRAPYPNTFWFSFPHTCPLKVWGEKSDANNACRAASRKGLCDIGKAPDGVECTFAYDILGWVPIDDVVGITSFKDDSGKLYGNFTTWCEASTDHIEFAGSDTTGKMDKGLDFWKDPLNSTANSERANKVITIYQELLTKDFVSTQISDSDLSHFKALPDPADLAKENPPCYKTVPDCNSGNGCKRSSFSQVCTTCKSASSDCKTDSSYKFPTLTKAPTTKSDSELTSGSKLGGKNGATGGITGKNSSSSSNSTSGAVAMPAGSFAVGAVTTLAASLVVLMAL